MSAIRLVALTLLAMRGRLLALSGFCAAFLFAALAARLLTGTHEGHVELDRLFQIGGAPLASGLLVLGWIIGRFPLIATLVMLGGIVSDERAEGRTRLYAARPVSLLGVYGLRFIVLTGIAFGVSALLMNVFDRILLGEWPGAGLLALIAGYVLAYAPLTALLSVWARGDAWIALLLAVLGLAWNALRAGGLLANAPPGAAEVVTMVLPPHGALFALERAFGSLQPVPWDALLTVALYGAILLALAGLSLVHREI